MEGTTLRYAPFSSSKISQGIMCRRLLQNHLLQPHHLQYELIKLQRAEATGFFYQLLKSKDTIQFLHEWSEYIYVQVCKIIESLYSHGYLHFLLKFRSKDLVLICQESNRSLTTCWRTRLQRLIQRKSNRRNYHIKNRDEQKPKVVITLSL